MVRRVVWLLALAGCAVDAAPEEEPVCEAGRVAACPCESGEDGSQECRGDGSAWGECLCRQNDQGDPAPVVDYGCSKEGIENSELAAAETCKAGYVGYYVECPTASGCTRQVGSRLYCCPEN